MPQQGLLHSAREVLSELEESYHEFGGNSFISDEVGTTKELPYFKED